MPKSSIAIRTPVATMRSSLLPDRTLSRIRMSSVTSSSSADGSIPCSARIPTTSSGKRGSARSRSETFTAITDVDPDPPPGAELGQRLLEHVARQPSCQPGMLDRGEELLGLQ